ncbi:hypothetical protein [Streptomyces sp. NPDC007088]|uniref:hypothetical protein n=1 Tax=Streptomyces sp. NPDC007088 TaxID=3364773 RepID=UPI0036B09C80
MPDMNECQICGAPAPPLPGQCEEVTGYRLIRNPWSPTPSFLDGNLHFSCLEASERRGEFFEEFTRMVRAGHEQIDSLDGSPPPLTRTGLGMTQIYAGSECLVFESGVSDRWMVVRRTGPWYRLSHRDLLDISAGRAPHSPADVVPYPLPREPGSGIAEWDLPELLTFLGVADRYAPPDELERAEYEFVDYYAPKRLLDYAVRAPLPLPREAREFLKGYAQEYVPVTFPDENEA